ncbi:MAG: phosphotransferase [Deinococcaceae bacterium]
MHGTVSLTDLRRQATVLGGGFHGDVFLWQDRVYKVYKSAGVRHLESGNMRFVGLQDWVLGSFETEGREVLMMKPFPGKPVSAQSLLGVSAAIGSWLDILHAAREGAPEVSTERVREKLSQFSELRHAETEFLFSEVEEALASGCLEVLASFCHLDLWSDNILVSESGEVLVVDWVRAQWDDPMRDIALLKTGTLDLLPEPDSLLALSSYVKSASDRLRLRAYLALTYLHDLVWLGKNQPETMSWNYPFKISRARGALGYL